MNTYRIKPPSERIYTLYEQDEPRDRLHRFRPGERAWNRGMTWDEMGISPEKRARILANLARGRASLDHHRCGGRNARPVIQMDMDGNRLHWYKSSEHAARKLGICARNIRGCCEGKRNKCGGFRWEFDERFLI